MGKEKFINILTIVNKVLQLVFEALAKAKNKSLAFLMRHTSIHIFNENAFIGNFF